MSNLPRGISASDSFPSRKFFVLLLALLLLVLATSPTPSYSQAAAGSVAGLITDPSGAAVLDATVTLRDRDTNTPRGTTSNDAGRYLFANVPPGTYEIAATKTGFRVAKVNKLVVTVGSPLTVDFKLELGSVAETVEVSTTGAELQTTNSTIGTTIAGESLLMLPNIGRETAAEWLHRRRRKRPEYISTRRRQHLRRHGGIQQHLHGQLCQYQSGDHRWCGDGRHSYTR
jgi:hypothetical protein